MSAVQKVSITATFLVLLSAASATSSVAADQDALAKAKELYMSAAYDEALATLREYRATPDSAVEADEYRTFCLLALGKTDDAMKIIEQMVAANPSFQPSDSQVSPRIQEAFRNVRRRVLPSIARRSYNDAREAFNRSDLDVAAKEFERVTALLADPDVAETGDLADLRLLSKGFGELIQKQQKPVVREAPVAARPATAQMLQKETRDPGRIYSAEDVDVTPPVAISQMLPAWYPTSAQTETYEGALIVVIDETGTVSSVRTNGTLWPPYETLVRQAASRWKYRPALKDGHAVKFQKSIAIRLQPAGGGR